MGDLESLTISSSCPLSPVSLLGSARMESIRPPLTYMSSGTIPPYPGVSLPNRAVLMTSPLTVVLIGLESPAAFPDEKPKIDFSCTMARAARIHNMTANDRIPAHRSRCVTEWAPASTRRTINYKVFNIIVPPPTSNPRPYQPSARPRKPR